MQETLASERLPARYVDLLDRWAVPLAARLKAGIDRSDRPPLIGINGAQASGKSTLAQFLSLMLRRAFDLRCPVISIDDIYATRKERARLAAEVHPLLATRGVPGTHDVRLGTSVIQALRDAGREEPVWIPRFDKAEDDRFPQSGWTRWEGPADLVILEGWCVGCPPQEDDALADPVNRLEREEDPDGIWRRHVNAQLAGPYADFFGLIDELVMLRAPDFECVFQWRLEQERKLEARLEEEGRTGTRLLTEETLRRFLAHYERLTVHMLSALPVQADVVYELDRERRIVAGPAG